VADQHATRRPAHPVARLVLALALSAYLTTAGGSLATTDAVATYEVTRQMLERGTLALSSDVVGNDAYRGPDGRLYSPFGLLQSLWNIPFYGAGRLASAVPPLRRVSPVMVTKAAVALGNAVAAALCVWLVWWLAWSTTGGDGRTASLAALLAAFATSLWPYSKFGFNVPLAACLVTCSVYASTRGSESRASRWAWAAGLASGLALLTRHELALIAIPSWAVLVWGWPVGWYRQLAWWVAGAAAPSAVWLWYNRVRFGSVLDTGYLRDETIGMGSSIASGLWGLLLSPGASIFLYSPITILAVVALVRLRHRFPRLVWQTAALAGIFTLFYAQMASWAGGRSYGPRYLVPFLPLLCVPLASWIAGLPARRRRWAVACCALSVLVQVPGVLVDFAKVRVDYARQFQAGSYEDRMHTWQACPLALNTRAAITAVPAAARQLAGLQQRPDIQGAAGDGSRSFSQQFAFGLDFWWVSLFYLGIISASISVAIGAVLTLVALVTGLALRATLRRDAAAAGTLLPSSIP
jgi:hypothetical protein